MSSEVHDAPILARISRATDLSGISRSTIYRLAGEGRIRVVKIGRTSLVEMSSLRALLDSLPPATIRPHGNRSKAA